jgi:hypothetical protein
MRQIRWNVALSQDTDESLRAFLASQGGAQKRDLSRFIEQAVRSHILELTAEQVKNDNTNVTERELATIVDEAVHWARSP